MGDAKAVATPAVKGEYSHIHMQQIILTKPGPKHQTSIAQPGMHANDLKNLYSTAGSLCELQSACLRQCQWR